MPTEGEPVSPHEAFRHSGKWWVVIPYPGFVSTSCLTADNCSFPATLLPPAGRSCAQETPECVVPAGDPTPVSSANRVVWWPLRGARGDGAHRPVVVPGNVPAARRCVLSRCAKREDTPKPRAAQSPQTTPSQLRPPWANRRWLSVRLIFKVRPSHTTPQVTRHTAPQKSKKSHGRGRI